MRLLPFFEGVEQCHEFSRKFGTSAGFAREDGKALQNTRVVAGVRIWF